MSRPTATPASAFETLWRPGIGELAEGHDPAAGAGRRGPAAGQRQARHTGGDDPLVDHADAARHRRPVAVDHGGGGRRPA